MKREDTFGGWARCGRATMQSESPQTREFKLIMAKWEIQMESKKYYGVDGEVEASKGVECEEQSGTKFASTLAAMLPF